MVSVDSFLLFFVDYSVLMPVVIKGLFGAAWYSLDALPVRTAVKSATFELKDLYICHPRSGNAAEWKF